MANKALGKPFPEPNQTFIISRLESHLLVTIKETIEKLENWPHTENGYCTYRGVKRLAKKLKISIGEIKEAEKDETDRMD